MSEVTLTQILLARETRAKRQKELLKTYGLPVISFTMNIAGPQKNSPLIRRAFHVGLRRLYESIDKDNIVFCEENDYDTGCEAFLSVDMDAHALKEICECIEEESALGRLFDIDVIHANSNKLCRKSERGCIVCGAPGRACSAGRLHSAEAVKEASDTIMRDFFFASDKTKIADLAVASLIKEVKTTPKPGLVDAENCGSHTDMDMDTFIKSATSLHAYFAECFSIGHRTRSTSPDTAFPLLKAEGLRAEKTMYAATNGVNTHKGIIYSLGLLCASVGRLWAPDAPYQSVDEMTRMCSAIAGSSIESDFNHMDTKTAGGCLYQKHGIKGIRGEVLSGFLTVKKHALPAYTDALSCGMHENDAGVFTLIKLIACVEDTNLYSRGGVSGAVFAKEYALSVLKEKSPDFIKDVQEMDDAFIKRNLSPGGCADLLAITYFLHDIQGLTKCTDRIKHKKNYESSS